MQTDLLHPLHIERPFNELERTTRTPNFRPIPVPEVLKQAKLTNRPLSWAKDKVQSIQKFKLVKMH